MVRPNRHLWTVEASFRSREGIDTKKSQEVAEQRKKAEADIGKTSAVMQKMLEKAEARFKPYSRGRFHIGIEDYG